MNLTTAAIRLSFSPPLALALTAILAAPAAAQEAQPPAPAATRHSQADSTISVKFRGGSFADYVSVIRNAGEKVNIVIPPMAADVQVPPLSIIDAEVEAALEVAAEIVDAKHRVKVRTHRSKLGRPIHVIQVYEAPAAPNLTGAVRTQGPPRTEVRVFSLCALTERLTGDPDQSDFAIKPSTILTAIDTGLAVASEEGVDKPVIRYHEDSGLLFVQGTPHQTNMVNEVLQRMENDVGRRRSAYILNSNSRGRSAPSQPGPSGPAKNAK